LGTSLQPDVPDASPDDGEHTDHNAGFPGAEAVQPDLAEADGHGGGVVGGQTTADAPREHAADAKGEDGEDEEGDVGVDGGADGAVGGRCGCGWVVGGKGPCLVGGDDGVEAEVCHCCCCGGGERLV